ncbi:MAG: hypothetical protein C3F07_06290 [Anaerolineales bacterium]|nr:MAG: hypothetical protein C3F07_06290 [Anaerolineales bacterium]
MTLAFRLSTVGMGVGVGGSVGARVNVSVGMAVNVSVAGMPVGVEPGSGVAEAGVRSCPVMLQANVARNTTMEKNNLICRMFGLYLLSLK